MNAIFPRVRDFMTDRSANRVNPQEAVTMRSRMIPLLVLVLIVLFGANEASAVSQAGGIGLQFPVGARYNAMGEAGTALSTDITALWWNVGGFAFAADQGEDHGLHFMYSPLAEGLAEDVSINWIGYGQYVEGWGMLGGSFTYLDQGEQQQVFEEGTEGTTFGSYQFAVNVGYGVKMTERLGLGLGVKYLRDELAPAEVTKDRGAGVGQSWGIDLGLHYKASDKLSLGLAATNLGPDITFIDAEQSDPMPRIFRAGLAYEAFSSATSAITLIYDYLDYFVEGDATKVHGFGAEWGYNNILFLRAGYKLDDEGDIKDYTAGAGFDLEKWIGRPMTFGYATVPQAEDLDRVNRFSLNFAF